MSALVPVDGRLLWTGAHAAIPANWLRDTGYDDRYLQGGEDGFTASAPGGNADHDHTADAHGLTGDAHIHLVTSDGATGTTTDITEGTEFGGNRVVIQELGLHGHSGATSSAATITYQNATPTIVTSGTAPPSIRAIVIKPDTTEADIPDDAICFTDENAAPAGFSVTDGGGTTDDLDGKFIRAPLAGEDGDVTGEGAATHTHTSVHTHTVIAHVHSAAASGAGNPSWGGTPGAQAVAVLAHHSVLLASEASSNLSSDDGNIDAVSNDPAYVELLGIQNTSGGALTSEGCIIGYVGTEASVASLIGWDLVNSATDRQIKITTTIGDIGNTGGSDTHTHATSLHLHIHSGAHTHIGFGTMAASTTRGTGGSTIAAVISITQHTHTWGAAGTIPITQNNTFTMSTDDVRLPYRTMIFIKRVPWTTIHIKGGAILGGAIL